MKRMRLIVTAAFILMAGASWAGPFDDGVAAYRRGDFTTALRLWRPLANQGIAEAQFNIGNMYYDGDGVQMNLLEAADLYLLAATQGYAPAQHNLARMYERGEGVKLSTADAIKLFRLAATQGYAEAQYALGFRYDRGQGVVQDYVEAAKWYRLAADSGHANAQLYLGVKYAMGQGVTQDYAEAVRWHRLAADQGLVSAQSLLGDAYYEGIGSPQNYADALKWYVLAALQGDAKAQSSLGYMYGTGKGVAQDYVEAHKWFNLSGANGNESAQKSRSILEGKMTQEQIAQAQGKAKTCLDSKYKNCGGSEGIQTKTASSSPTPRSQSGSASMPSKRTAIPLQKQGGTYVVPVLLNDAITLNFVVDSGAADVSIPADVVSTLIRTGTLKQSDFLGKKTYVLADGSKLPSQTFRIRSMKVGDRMIEKLTGNVAPLQGSLLLGQSFLSRFKSWSIDNDKHVLLLE